MSWLAVDAYVAPGCSQKTQMNHDALGCLLMLLLYLDVLGCTKKSWMSVDAHVIP